jgi:tetratricopeptide (TPR) repeat protein
MRRTRLLFPLLLLGALLGSGVASSATLSSVEPAPGDVVATQLLPRSLKQSLRDATRPAGETQVDLRQRLAAARKMIEVGRTNGDPRTLGYAESLLAPWPPDAPDAPVDAVVLHATIAQSRHAFARAATLLDRVLERTRPGEPAYAQALLTRATIGQVTGHLSAARTDCQRLAAVARDVAAICVASVDVLAGELDVAVPLLRIAAARTSDSVRSWALAVLAQAYEQGGERASADAAYRAALGAGDDLVTRLAYADFLLAERLPEQAANVLDDAPATDGVVLRQWRIARALRNPEAAALEQRLHTRLADARQRGDGSDLLHARDWAQFELERGDASDALRLARANWRAQREPADLLILARAAGAARDDATRAEVRTWLAATKLQDVRIVTALQEAQR